MKKLKKFSLKRPVYRYFERKEHNTSKIVVLPPLKRTDTAIVRPSKTVIINNYYGKTEANVLNWIKILGKAVVK